MIIRRVIHQQIFQLRWQLLACLGLIMVLPLEEATVNLYDGAGFYSEVMSLYMLFLSPFLAGLIACANVQADLDDKRYIFWVSKPVGIKTFITLKYLVGLVLALIIMACPVVFAVVSNAICKTDCQFIKMNGGTPVLLIAVLVSLLTYSLCFLCNVLVRKTARAWLIGITATGFLLLVPFMLPLNFRDVATDIIRLASSIYVVVFLVVILGAFVVSLFAVRHNWHVQTNLKGLFWIGAGLAFMFMMMFSRQVANIKVLDELKTNDYGHFMQSGDRFVLGDNYVNIQDGRIELEAMDPLEYPDELRNIDSLYVVEEGLHRRTYPRGDTIFFKSGDNRYYFKFHEYYHQEKNERGGYKVLYKHLYLCSYKMLDEHYSKPVEALDLSEFIQDESYSRLEMRLIGDKLIVLVNNSYAVVKVGDKGDLILIDKKYSELVTYSYGSNDEKNFKIPHISIEEISIEEQIRLTIDRNFIFYGRGREHFSRHSIVYMLDDQIRFAVITNWGVARYYLNKKGNKFLNCQFVDSRPFTFLEQMFDDISQHDKYFVKDGKLYAYNRQKLMIFDIRSERIRKLGHFERLSDNFRIEDVEVLEDGNILMNVWTEVRSSENRKDWIRQSHLYLLKNPE